MNAKKEFDNFRRFIGEYEIMNSLNHPNILKALGIFFGDKEEVPKIVLEFCPTSFDKAIIDGSLTKVQIVIGIYQIAEGMKYVHFNKVIHRDLKPNNILIAEDGTFKIADFGISKIMSTEEQQTFTIVIGTLAFMAPEIIDGEEYNEKVDVYSFGILVCFALNNGKIPKIKMKDLFAGKKIEFPSNFNEFSTNLINECLSFDASRRPSFNEILDQLESCDYNLMDLSKSEIKEVKKFVKQHKEAIPSY